MPHNLRSWSQICLQHDLALWIVNLKTTTAVNKCLWTCCSHRELSLVLYRTPWNGILTPRPSLRKGTSDSICCERSDLLTLIQLFLSYFITSFFLFLFLFWLRMFWHFLSFAGFLTLTLKKEEETLLFPLQFDSSPGHDQPSELWNHSVWIHQGSCLITIECCCGAFCHYGTFCH